MGNQQLWAFCSKTVSFHFIWALMDNFLPTIFVGVFKQSSEATSERDLYSSLLCSLHSTYLGMLIFYV
jgi:hypothetical protein